MTQTEYEALVLRTERAIRESRLRKRAYEEAHEVAKPAWASTQSEDESELHNQIADWCRYRGWLAFHGSMAHRSRRTIGEPDFIICTDDNRVLFVEAKTRTGKLKPEQLAISAHLRKLGQHYHVVRSLAEFMDVVAKSHRWVMRVQDGDGQVYDCTRCGLWTANPEPGEECEGEK